MWLGARGFRASRWESAAAVTKTPQRLQGFRRCRRANLLNLSRLETPPGFASGVSGFRGEVAESAL